MTGIRRTTGWVAATRWVVGRVAGFFFVAAADSFDVDSSVVSVSTSVVVVETQPVPATAQTKLTQTVRQNRMSKSSTEQSRMFAPATTRFMLKFGGFRSKNA